MIYQKTIRASWLLAGAFLLCAPAFAQDGRVEAAGFGGGLAIADGGGVHPLFGGSAGVRATEHLRVFGEFSVAPLASASISESGVTGTGTDRLYNIGGGLDYSLGSSKTVVPYFLGAVGVGHEVASASASGNGVSISASMASNSIYLGAGGGVRIYAGHNWGFKPEFRYQRYIASGGSSNSAAFSVGLFLQFGK